MDNLNIDRLTMKLSACKAMKPKLIEDKRLLTVWSSTNTFFDV